MIIFANKNTLVTLLSFAFASAICLPIQAQFGGGNLDSALEQDIAKLEEKVHKLEQKANISGKFMLDLKKSPLADMQNSQISVFRLKYIRASSAAATISNLLGEEGFRLAIEEKSNQLIVSAPAEISKAIGELLQKIDAAPAQENEKRVTSQKQSAPKSLQVHTFWLADGLNKDEGRLTTGFLTNSVYHALQKLGLETPRIVARSTSSLIAESNIGVDTNANKFSSKMSATINGRALQFESQGKLNLLEQQQIDLQMRTIISGISHVSKDGLGRDGRRITDLVRFNECEVEGSLTAPLGHYMVLGTANYVGANCVEKQPTDKSVQMSDTNEAGSPQGKLATSRFAFVIQVVEAGSFAPEK